MYNFTRLFLSLLINKLLSFMNSGKDKKTVVIAKNAKDKKPSLQINTNLNEQHQPLQRSGPNSFGTTSAQQQLLAQYKSVSTVNTPTNQRNSITNCETVEMEQPNLNKKQPLQKKTSHKQPLTNSLKIEQHAKVQPPNALNGFVSPKTPQNKQKVLFSNASQKILPPMKQQKKQTFQRDRHSIKIQELQKIVEESKIRNIEFSAKEGEYEQNIQQLRAENNELKKRIADLQKKNEKILEINAETKKMLKQRIHSFNEEGGELQALRNQIKTLQARVQSLLAQNVILKAEINKYSDYNLKQLANIRAMPNDELVTSNVREVPLQGSRISQMYLKQSEGDLLQFSNMENMEQNIDLQSYISETEGSCLEQYKNNVDIFDKIKQQYEEILADIEIRYKNMAKDYDKSISQQAAEICALENRNDELQQQAEAHSGSREKLSVSLHLDEIILRNQQEIADLTVHIYDLKEHNKELLEEVQHHRVQCKLLEAELDIERMKKKFKNENDKFEFNVVKLNLLNIIDKLKMQIDKEKAKFKKLYDRFVANRSGIEAR